MELEIIKPSLAFQYKKITRKRKRINGIQIQGDRKKVAG